MFEVETASWESHWIEASFAGEKFTVIFLKHIGLWGV
jgi:hypothetical protein